MTKTITQKVVFENTTPKKMYSIYMNAKENALAIGAEVKIINEPDTPYTAHGKLLKEKTCNWLKIP